MNVERLHVIARVLREELDGTDTRRQLRELVNGLRSMVQEPNQPAYQQQVSSTRASMADALREAGSNEFPETWQQVLEELGITGLLGRRLSKQIEEVFERNEITPSAAAEELGPLADEVEKFDDALDQLLAGLEFFRIGSEKLEPGDFEIGFLVPRAEVHEELGELGVEFQNLRRVIEPFMELATGNRPPIRVRTIASSEFQVFLESTPLTAYLFTRALKTVLETYDKLLDIRLKHQQWRT
jgi:hypothetical protein